MKCKIPQTNRQCVLQCKRHCQSAYPERCKYRRNGNAEAVEYQHPADKVHGDIHRRLRDASHFRGSSLAAAVPLDKFREHTRRDNRKRHEQQHHDNLFYDRLFLLQIRRDIQR